MGELATWVSDRHVRYDMRLLSSASRTSQGDKDGNSSLDGQVHLVLDWISTTLASTLGQFRHSYDSLMFYSCKFRLVQPLEITN